MQSTGLSPIAGRPSKYVRHEDSIRFLRGSDTGWAHYPQSSDHSRVEYLRSLKFLPTIASRDVLELKCPITEDAMGPMDPVRVLVVDEKLPEPCVYRQIPERNDCQSSS